MRNPVDGSVVRRYIISMAQSNTAFKINGTTYRTTDAAAAKVMRDAIAAVPTGQLEDYLVKRLASARRRAATLDKLAGRTVKA